MKNQLILIKQILKEQSYLKKFIGYMNKGNARPSPLCIKILQINICAKYIDINNKCINLLVDDREIFEICNKIWDKIKNLFGKNLIVNQCIIINTYKLK